MNFKFIREDGKEVEVNSLSSFIELVKSDQIKDDTLLYDYQNSAWKKASEFEEFQVAMSQMEQPPGRKDEVHVAVEQNTAFQPPKYSKKNRLVLSSIVLIVVSVAMLIFTSLRYYSNPGEGILYRLAGMVGYSPLIALGSYLVWRFIFQEKKGIGLMCFSIILFAMSSYQSATMLREVDTARKAVSDINTTVMDILHGQRIQQKSFENRAYGEMTPVLEFFNSYAIQTQSDFSQMNDEIQQQSPETLFSPICLKDLAAISKAHLKLERCRGILDKYESLFRQRSQEASKRISDLDLPEHLKREVMSGFNKTKERGLQSLSEFFNTERSFISAAQTLLSFLSQRQGEYWFQGNQVIFLHQEDTDTYNFYLQQISSIAKQEEAWRKRVQQEGLTAVKQLEEITK